MTFSQYWVSASPNVTSQKVTTATLLWTARPLYTNRSDQAPRMWDVLQDRPSRESHAIFAAGQALWRLLPTNHCTASRVRGSHPINTELPENMVHCQRTAHG